MCSLFGFSPSFGGFEGELVPSSAWIRWNLLLGAGWSYKCSKKRSRLARIQNHLREQHWSGSGEEMHSKKKKR